MKLLLFATVYEYGGISKVIENLLGNIDTKRFQPVFCVERLALKSCPLPKGVKIINMEVRPAKGFQKIFNIYRHLYNMKRIAQSEKPDIIMGFGSTINWQLVLAFLLPAKKKYKVVLCEYSEQFFIKQALIMARFRDRILRHMYKMIMFLFYHKADAVICVSNSLAGHIGKFFLMDRKKIKVIYVPVNISQIRTLCEEKSEITDSSVKLPCIGTVSRLSKEKGINYIIEAFYGLLKKMDARLAIAGDGEERKNLETMVKGLGIEDKVSFLGWMKNPYSCLKGMDVFILASLWEGFPNVIIESMICGVPVVAARSVGGIEEAVQDGVDGLLVPVKDSKALSSAIYRILQDTELKKSLTEKAGSKIRQFDAGKITREYEAVISNL